MRGSVSPFPAGPAAPAGAAAAAFADTSQKALGAANTLSPYPLAPILGVPLPPAFDEWRRGGYLSPPGDQAKCGACYVFAAVGQLGDRIAIATRKRVALALSTQFVLSCLQSEYEYGCGGTLDVPPIYHALMPRGHLGGTYRHYVFPYSGQQWDPAPVADPGSVCYYAPAAPDCSGEGPSLDRPAHCYPPRPSTGMACSGTVPCDVSYIRRWYPHEPKYSYSKVLHLSENTNAGHLYPGLAAAEHYDLSVPVPMTPAQLANNTRRIKEAIYLYGPVTAVIPVYADLSAKLSPGSPHWNSPDYVYGVDPAPSNKVSGLHHILLVGWGRDAAGTDFWIVKNSWGVWWNFDGYFNARAGDPLLLVESNCHSAFPIDPETGRMVEPFDHPGEDNAAFGAALARVGAPPQAAPDHYVNWRNTIPIKVRKSV